jgi:hypothetical protein
MEHFTLDQLKGLAQQAAKPSISLFLPTHRTGQDTRQDPIRLKNLLRDAEQHLLNSGMGPREVSALLQPAQALLDDSYFWRHQYDGLAIFMAADDFHSYRLPFCVEELLIIARSYYVKPVLPLFTNNGHYYILIISQNEVRLFEGTRHGVGQIALQAEIPTSLNEALKLDEPEIQLQMHTGSSPGGASAGMFHGQGSGAEEQEAGIEHYLNLVDSGLKKFFREQQAPLVLAGVDYLLPIHRKVSEYAHIMPEGIISSCSRAPNPTCMKSCGPKTRRRHWRIWNVQSQDAHHQGRRVAQCSPGNGLQAADPRGKALATGELAPSGRPHSRRCQVPGWQDPHSA